MISNFHYTTYTGWFTEHAHNLMFLYWYSYSKFDFYNFFILSHIIFKFLRIFVIYIKSVSCENLSNENTPCNVNYWRDKFAEDIHVSDLNDSCF